MRHGIDYPSMQKLENLFLDDLPHRIIEPTLRLTRGCARWVYRDARSAEGRADSLKVLERVTEYRSMVF
jgi:plasmid replication initiation protein